MTFAQFVSEAKQEVTCSRCGGSGHYSFNLMKGTVCFKCNGKGAVSMTPAEIARQASKSTPTQKPLTTSLDLAVLFGMSKPDIGYAERNPAIMDHLQLTMADYKYYADLWRQGERKISRDDYNAAHARYQAVKI